MSADREDVINRLLDLLRDAEISIEEAEEFDEEFAIARELLQQLQDELQTLLD